MSEPRTALNGASFDGLVKISERPATGMITLRADLGEAGVGKAIKKVFGVDMPAQRGTAMKGDTGALWMSPDEVMLLCSYTDAASKLADLNKALGKTHALAADVSDARAAFRLEGEAIREVLAKITPADMRATSLPVGELRRTRLAQVAGAFWFHDDITCDLICFRSVAGYVFDLLSVSAKPGSAVGHF